MDKEFVTLIDTMGSDLSVVNAARVSFSKKSQWARHIPSSGTYELSHGDQKLIQYLAKHGHWTPFGHCSLSFHIKAPVFVARQLIKHQVGLVWNEVSRRYVDDAPDFYDPEHWRARAEDKKQGSNADEPQSMMTEWYWTGSLYAFSRVCNLRCKPDTQEETRNIAWEIHDLAKEKFPISWESLTMSKDEKD